MGENHVEKLVQECSNILSEITEQYEIILVNDASPDQSWNEIERMANSNFKVKGISLRSNVGQHPAILEGLKHTKGELTVVIDCDLQESPHLIKQMIVKQKGFDYVLAKRKKRKASFIEKITSNLFYFIVLVFKNAKIDSQTANFGVFSRATIDKILINQNTFKFFPLALAKTKMKCGTVDMIHQERHEGDSTYNFATRLKLALDILNTKKPNHKISIKTTINI